MGGGCSSFSGGQRLNFRGSVGRHDNDEDFYQPSTSKTEYGYNKTGQKEERFFHFGPMVLKEQTKVALVVTTLNDETFSEIQNALCKLGYQCGLSATEEEMEERFHRLWPCLIIIDDRHKKTPSFSVDNIVKKLRISFEDDSAAIFVLCEKWPPDKRRRQLMEAGVTKVIKYDLKTFVHELNWFESVLLPVQMKIRSAPALFAALEHCSSPIEITDSENFVQFINAAYEQLTGCHKDDVLGTFASDLRRKSLPKEALLHASTTSNQSKIESNDPTSTTIDEDNGNGTQGVSIKITEDDSQNNTANGWQTFPVSYGASSSGYCQYVHLKQSTEGQSGLKPFNGFYYRPPSFRNRTLTVDTPVAEILSLLKDALQKCKDEDMKKCLQKIIKILNTAELYSPLITKFKNDDKVASNLFGGLVLNGPLVTIQRGRKASLCEVMKSEKNVRINSGMLKNVSPNIRNVLEFEETWQFDILELERLTSRRPLVHLGMKIFERWKVSDFLQCTETCLRLWLEIIENNYHCENPYHNSAHAADVLQATAYYLSADNISNSIEHIDAVSALLASVIHDVDHPGKGSAFLINTKHPLALLYNDVSVLENHHAALGFQLTVSDSRVNIFDNLNRADYVAVRKSMVDMVLATDMNKHFEYLAKFQTSILSLCQGSSSDVSETPSKGSSSPDPKRIICRMLIKCADVSNPSRPWHLCKEWAYRIVEEYFAQTAEERAKGLPLTMEVFDRETCNVPQTQCSFIDMFVREMFKGWCSFGGMPELMTQIEENYKHWRDESVTWPQLRHAEMAKVQNYLSVIQADAAGSRSLLTRASIDVPLPINSTVNLIEHGKLKGHASSET